MGKKRVLSGFLAFVLTLFGSFGCALPSEFGDLGLFGSESEADGSADSAGESASSSEENAPPKELIVGDLSIHFLYFGNAVSGDSTLIKVGNTEVLIDAGSTRGSANTIIPYIQDYCTDGVLEYVIATHAHEDHIAAFVGDKNTKGVFDVFECGTIIDYTAKNTTSDISIAYARKRNAEVAAGAKHYTALQCWNQTDGASRSYTLGEGITLNILYQKYYEDSTSNENNYSVCTLLSNGDEHYLFTGDLESGGEASLVESNDLPECVLYKGGHHGSRTSSSTVLLERIKPQIVCVCSCCGDKHDFVHQEFIDNVAPYTERVYITTVNENGAGLPLNGNIVVYTLNGAVQVKCSNNDILFKDTEWFKKNRTCPEAWKEQDLQPEGRG